MYRLLNDFRIWLRQRRQDPKLYPRRHIVWKFIAQLQGWRGAADEDNLIWYLCVWHPKDARWYEGQPRGGTLRSGGSRRRCFRIVA